MRIGNRPLRPVPARLGVLPAAIALVVCSWLVFAPFHSLACSSFVLDNNGHAIFGTNYDNAIWPGLLFVNKAGVKKTGISTGIDGEPLRWTARYASITFAVSGYHLPWAGMNEAGLTLSTMALSGSEPPAADERQPLDWGPLWMQYILDTCATIEEVMATDARVRIVNDVGHYLVGEGSGRGAVIELLGGEMVVYTGDDLPVAALTNSPYQELVATWYANRGTTSCLRLPDSERRFCLVAERVDGFQPTTSEEAVSTAFDTLQLVAGEDTQWSIVFDTERLRASFRTLSNRQIRFVDLRQIDLWCQAPALMLDVHEPLAGDITGDLFDLSYDLCYEHTLQYLITTGRIAAIPPQMLQSLLDQVIGFPCDDHRRISRRVR